jgi:hypothetical protein
LAVSASSRSPDRLEGAGEVAVLARPVDVVEQRQQLGHQPGRRHLDDRDRSRSTRLR